MSVATTYAEALFASAEDAGAVEAVAAEVAGFARAMHDAPDLSSVLANPDVETRAKRATVASLTEGSSPLTANFLQVLIDRGRIAEFPEIARAFQERVTRAAGRLEVEAITAVPLSDELRQRIVTRVQGQTGATVDLTESVDPEIVGGLVLRVGSVVVDGSLRHRIDQLGRTLRGASVDAATAAP